MKDGDILRLKTPSGSILNLEVAFSSERQRQGLQRREPLKDAGGMFFFYTDVPQVRCMWMPNMKMSLDILWLDSSLNIVSISRNVKPCEMENTDACPFICSNVHAQHAIEIREGQLQSLGLKEGSHLEEA